MRPLHLQHTNEARSLHTQYVMCMASLPPEWIEERMTNPLHYQPEETDIHPCLTLGSAQYKSADLHVDHGSLSIRFYKEKGAWTMSLCWGVRSSRQLTEEDNTCKVFENAGTHLQMHSKSLSRSAKAVGADAVCCRWNIPDMTAEARLFRHEVCPRLSWSLLVDDNYFPITWLECKLQSTLGHQGPQEMGTFAWPDQLTYPSSAPREVAWLSLYWCMSLYCTKNTGNLDGQTTTLLILASIRQGNSETETEVQISISG